MNGEEIQRGQLYFEMIDLEQERKIGTRGNQMASVNDCIIVDIERP
jgi:hypothetical protein